MKMLNISLRELENVLRNKLNNKFINQLNITNISELRPLVYTSFDGDFWSQSEPMKQFVFKNGMVPLNPESALGTYLVVNHYLGKKYQIILDCLKLLSICDVFWIMTDFEPKEIKDIGKLPEGVIAEALFWAKHKNQNISLVDITKYKNIKQFKITDNSLNFLHPLQREGIKKVLKTKLQTTRDVVYLMAGEKHAKHSDWLRKDAYNNQKIPLCPYTIFNKGTLDIAYGKNEIKKLLARVSLAIKADEIWIYGKYRDDEVKLHYFEIDLLQEIYLILRLKPKKIKIIYKFFGDINIPKYSNKTDWAITDYEKKLQ